MNNRTICYDFKEFIDFHQISHSIAGEICGVHRTTLDRWIQNKSRAPFTAFELLRLHATREIPSSDNSWHDWRFENNLLTCNLYRRKYRPVDILMIGTLELQVRELHDLKQNYTLQSKLF